MAHGHGLRCELGILPTAPECDHRNGRQGSRTCEERRATHVERRAGGGAWARALSGSDAAGARRRPRRRPRGGGHDAAGCRRQDAGRQERRVMPRKRRAHATHADDDRGVRAGRWRHRRGPRSGPAMTVRGVLPAQRRDGPLRSNARLHRVVSGPPSMAASEVAQRTDLTVLVQALRSARSDLAGDRRNASLARVQSGALASSPGRSSRRSAPSSSARLP